MSKSGAYRAFTSVAAVCALLASTAQAQDRPAPDAGSLRSVYDRAIRDSNGDGLGDEIVARVIVPAQPSMQDVEAAANIAARLGYETTAASLPVTLSDDRAPALSSIALPILVGRQNRFVKELVAEHRLSLEGLAPGQGLVSLASVGGGEPQAVVVVGGDDAGTLAASVEVAARLPRLWNATGATLAMIEEQALAYLKGRDIPATRVAVTSIVVDAARRGIADVKLQVLVPAGAGPAALKAFEALDAEHRFGRESGVLDLAAAASTTVEVRTEQGVTGQAVVRRIGPNWRALASLPPSPPPPSLAALVSATASPPADTARPAPHCVGCPVYLVDGMVTGGGGATYGSFSPKEPVKAKPFDLAEVYTINGWYGDRYRDLIPDITEASLIVGGDPAEALGAAVVAARLGLETTGVTLPIAKRDDEILQPQSEQSPILVGRGNVLVQALIQAGKVRLDDLKAGEGVLAIVPRAFGTSTATVVAGADAAGAAAASFHLARRLPYVWETRPGSVTLDDLKAQVSDFLAARTAAGQAALAADALAAILERAKAAGAPLDAIDVKLYLESPDQDLERYLAKTIAQQTGRRKVSIEVRAISTPVVALDDKFSLPWEGDDFWAKLRADVLPRVASGDSVELEARLSEDPAVRARIAQEARAALIKAGAKEARVEINSAYKQGYFWLVDQVLPELRAKPVKSLHIAVRAATPDYSRKLQIYEHPARWIKELYPADEIFKRELGLPIDSFVIEQVEDQKSVYSLEAKDGDGKVVYSASFDPSVVEREFMDAAPGRSRVQVETGLLSAAVNGRPVVRERIETDIERVWDSYQARVLPKVRDYILQATNGHPVRDKAPFFRDLKINAFVSEPDYEFGVEGEHISSPEGLAQDLAQLTNAYLASIGAPSAGRVIPLVLARDGQEGEVSVTLTRNAAPNPRLEVSYRRRGDKAPVRVVEDLTASASEGVQVMRIVAGQNRLSEIGLQAKASSPDAASRAAKALASLVRLQTAGLFQSTLSYDHVDRLSVAIEGPASREVVNIRNTGVSAPSDVHVARTRPATPLVNWDHVINSAESEDVIRKLSYYPGVAAYRKARSYEGRDISVLEITEPAAGELVSVAKIAAYKPTALIVGRQHGSEPSSTSYILRIAERLASDPGFSDIVRKVNVVLLPIMNPDGAALAGEIRKFRPLDIASAGYLSAIAQDVTVSTKLPESVVDPYLWRRWLPDLYMNAHGASSHEVVQPFSGYASSQAPTYTFRRGWYSLAFRTPLDPRYDRWRTAALGLREAMATEVGSDPTTRAGNLNDYARFARWGRRFAPHLEQLETYKDTALFYTDQGSGELLGLRRLPDPPPETPEANRDARIGDWPTVTLDGGTIEAADEGAQGRLLELAAQDGFDAVLSQLKYLRDGTYRLERIDEEAPLDGARLTTLRLRPVMPPKSGGAAAP